MWIFVLRRKNKSMATYQKKREKNLATLEKKKDELERTRNLGGALNDPEDQRKSFEKTVKNCLYIVIFNMFDTIFHDFVDFWMFWNQVIELIVLKLQYFERKFSESEIHFILSFLSIILWNSFNMKLSYLYMQCNLILDTYFGEMMVWIQIPEHEETTYLCLFQIEKIVEQEMENYKVPAFWKDAKYHTDFDDHQKMKTKVISFFILVSWFWNWLLLKCVLFNIVITIKHPHDEYKCSLLCSYFFLTINK